MPKRVLLTIVAAALGLNMWLGDRIPAGLVCPILVSPSAAPLVPDGTTCARICPVRR